MLSTVMHPHMVREPLRGILISAEDMGDDFSAWIVGFIVCCWTGEREFAGWEGFFLGLVFFSGFWFWGHFCFLSSFLWEKGFFAFVFWLWIGGLGWFGWMGWIALFRGIWDDGEGLFILLLYMGFYVANVVSVVF